MTKIIEKYFSNETVDEIVQKHNYNKEFSEEFVRYLELFLIDLDSEETEDRDSSNDIFIELTEKYTCFYALKRQEGYSIEWSKKFAEIKCEYDTKNILPFCYDSVREHNTDKAMTDVLLFCKLNNGDEFYIDYLIKNLNKGNDGDETPIENKAAEYSQIFKEQINNGKSEIFAYQYAKLIANGGYHKIFCEDYAYAYEKAISKEKNKEYAKTYADKYASELIDVKIRFGISDDEESLDFAKSKADAYINAWEYAKTNKLKNIERFIDFYENIYLNKTYPDNPDDYISEEECKTISSTKAMEKYLEIKELEDN